jgi:hypothetical protein
VISEADAFLAKIGPASWCGAQVEKQVMNGKMFWEKIFWRR